MATRSFSSVVLPAPECPVTKTSSPASIVKLMSFVSAHHTCTASLHYGAGAGTHKSADVVADMTLDDGSIERTSTFNTASIADGFTVEIDGTTDGVGDNFVVAQRIAFASP